MIDDIEVVYLGISVKVTHSFYKPSGNVPGRIRYTFNLPTKKVTIEELRDPDGNFYWAEVGKGKTDFANELGLIIEQFDRDSNKPEETNILEDIEVPFNGKQVRVSHSMVAKEMNDTGNIIYTFHFRSGPVSIRQYKDHGNFLWKEIPGGNTKRADELGRSLEEYYNDDN